MKHSGSFKKGHKVPQEWRDKVSKIHKGKKLSLGHVKKLRGRIPWNKGKTGIYSIKTLKLMGKNRIGKIPWNKGKYGICKPNSGSFKNSVYTK